MYRLALLTLAVSALSSCAGSTDARSGNATMAQAERACANAGVAPGSGVFASCVDNLLQTLRDDASFD
jgi:hypothetical protein